MGSASLELFRPKQRVGEVEEEPGGHDAGEPIVEDHDGSPLEPVAGVGVADRGCEKAKTESNQDEVQHASALQQEGPCRANRRFEDAVGAMPRGISHAG